MVYQVIALKHRPRKFSDVVAQDHIITPLRNAVESGRIHHGYLFSGPRGTGKTTTARVLSKALNCETPEKGEPCTKCTSCMEIAATNSPNVIEIDAASNRGIDDIRELREAIRYSPLGAKYKIYIIDEVHQLTSEAFNALLKTLEEPPPHGIFILATTEPQKVPATIVSRCLKFDFRLIPLTKLIETVEAICRKEGVDIEREGIESICVKADGSLRDALSLLDQVISSGVSKIDAPTVAEILGLVDKRMLLGISTAVASSQPINAINHFSNFVRMGGNVEYFIDSLNRHFRDLLVIKLNVKEKSFDGIADEMLDEYRAIAAMLDDGQLLRILNILAELFAGLRRRTADPIISVELALVKMAKLDKTIDLEKLFKAEPERRALPSVVDDLFQSHQIGPVNDLGESTEPPEEALPKTEIPVENPPTHISELNFDVIARRWPEVIKELNKKKKTLWAQLNGSVPVSLSGSNIKLKVEHEGIAKSANLPINQKLMEELTTKIFGHPLRLECTTLKDKLSQEREVSSAEQEYSAAITGDDIVDRTLEELGGRLLNWEPKDK
ncbi:MAG: hypothetical protein CO189_03265 [candidate division Zixibacteria bacterium CG_4_9_14_3_um_filter_46_8]|nr:MAG: hypothetical protein CO189_03265 [candidate division Zixibacteria bacterium CG_4_9_14_3_um_filter_46_8]